MTPQPTRLHRWSFSPFLVAASACVLFTTATHADPPTPKFEHQTIDKISIGYGVAIGDVDGDKKPDILLADKKQFVWYQNPGAPNKPWPKHVMVENLTPLDNVCLAARDINGDGKVEVAVGAMWNPGNTTDPSKSGSVHYLIRPKDPTQKWTPVKLKHEVTTHRMRWVKTGKSEFQLVVLPLHGQANRGGQGAGVKILAYAVPDEPSDASAWKTTLINDTMHMTHNLDVVAKPGSSSEWLLIAGKEGVRSAWLGGDGQWKSELNGVDGKHYAAGEVRAGQSVMKDRQYRGLYATVEPMHGNACVAYVVKKGPNDKQWQVKRHVLFETMRHGHALAVADVLGRGRDQIVIGWRMPDQQRKVGVAIFEPTDFHRSAWAKHLVDDNGMACEDLRIADLDGDGRPDIIAAGRATKNLKVYWNRTPK